MVEIEVEVEQPYRETRRRDLPPYTEPQKELLVFTKMSQFYIN